MNIEKIIHRKASDYVSVLQNPDAPELDMRKPGRPPKNGESATAHIHIRTTLARKIAWVKAAKGKPLAEMITEIVDNAIEFT